MNNKKVLVGVPNEGETSIDVEAVKSWVPTDLTVMTNIVFFKVEGTFYSMRLPDFLKYFKLS